MPEISLRKITEADAPLLVRWRNENAEFFPSGATMEGHWSWFQGYLEDPSDNMFMVLYGVREIGCLSMTIKDGRGELGRVIVGDKAACGKGFMDEAFRQLMSAYGLPSYWLKVYSWNMTAIRFYKRNGFTAVSTEGEYLIMEHE